MTRVPFGLSVQLHLDMSLSKNAPEARATAEAATEARADQVGFCFGLLAFAVLGLLIYIVFLYLSELLGEEAAYLVTILPAFFAFLIIQPAQRYAARYYKRVHCKKHGHNLKSIEAKDGTQFVVCMRCGSFLKKDKSSEWSE